MLKGKSILKRFGGLVALSAVDFELQEKEIVGLIGPNGSGKTTLFNVISGLCRPESGEITFKGKSIIGLPVHVISLLGIGRTFQIVRPFLELSVLENIVFAVLYGRDNVRSARVARERASHLLEFTGLYSKIGRLPGELSLEDRKRLEIARALALKPQVILLDEVFAGLNSSEIEKAVKLTFRIRDEFAVTIFMIEHVMKAIMNTCVRVIVLHHGIKIFEGVPEEVVKNEQVIKAYLGTSYAKR
jgi:branched-chain amino acid transport system ATP-binding protein